MQETASKQIIPGTVTRFGGSEMIISTGIPSLDELLGDGVPTGSLVIIDEDTRGMYSRVLLKYFLAEGIVNKHNLFVASLEIPSETLIQQLPMLIESKPPVEDTGEPDVSWRKMKIAFRYDNLPTEEKEAEQKFGHYYDLSGVMNPSYIRNCRIVHWDDSKEIKSGSFYNQKYYSLLKGIKEELQKFDNNNVLRIGIHSLGSPLWNVSPNANREESFKDLSLFLYMLRSMIQSVKVVALVTIPVHLFEKFDRVLHLSDVYIRLQAFSGTELGENKYLSDFHGFFHLDKLTAKNAFRSKLSSAIEYVFKLRRKKFVIEILHLPPDLDASEVKLSCGGGSKLDF